MDIKIDVFEGKSMIKGEIRTKSTRIRRADGTPFIVSGATYQIFSHDGPAGEIQPADIISAPDYKYADIGAVVNAGSVAGRFYIEFTEHIDMHVLKQRIAYNVY